MTLKELKALITFMVLVAFPLTVSAQSTVLPESVGLSTQRLERINVLAHEFMESGQIT